VEGEGGEEEEHITEGVEGEGGRGEGGGGVLNEELRSKGEDRMGKTAGNWQERERERESMILMRLGSEEKKRKVWQNKGKLKGKETWIEEDLTWEERRVRWKMMQWVRKRKKEPRTGPDLSC